MTGLAGTEASMTRRPFSSRGAVVPEKVQPALSSKFQTLS
jgi:hypothetical protein